MSEPVDPRVELVALVDESGRQIGSAPRSEVRRRNLLHGATAVLVRHPDGRIYVHRRTATKDWAPAHWDAAAGGVLQAGEDPAESALRELEEELGITGVTLRRLGGHLYEDSGTRCFEYAFTTTWAGPIWHQPEEVAEGRWMSLTELEELLADPDRPFVPDTRKLLATLWADL